MMKKIILIICIILLCTGCTTLTNIRRTAFPISLYVSINEEGKYEIAVLVINPSSLSKIELESGNTNNEINIYTNIGDTFTDAMNRIDIEAKHEISMMYIKSIVFHSSIAEDMEEVLKNCMAFYKSPKYRSTIWIYATDLKYTEIFNIIPDLDSSPYFSLINDPLGNEQFETLPPMNINDILVRYYNGKRMFLLPKISVSEEKNYTDDDGDTKAVKTYDVDGYYFSSYEKDSFAYLEFNDLDGFKWIDIIMPINYEISEEEDKQIVCEIFDSDFKIKDNMIIFNITASIRTNIDNLSFETIQEMMIQAAKKDLNSTFNLAKEHKIDIYFLERYKTDITKMEELTIEVNLRLDSKIRDQESL